VWCSDILVRKFFFILVLIHFASNCFCFYTILVRNEAVVFVPVLVLQCTKGQSFSFWIFVLVHKNSTDVVCCSKSVATVRHRSSDAGYRSHNERSRRHRQEALGDQVPAVLQQRLTDLVLLQGRQPSRSKGMKLFSTSFSNKGKGTGIECCSALW